MDYPLRRDLPILEFILRPPLPRANGAGNTSPADSMARYFFGIDGTMLVERRSTPRYDYEAGIEVKLAGGGSVRGMTQNISDAGMQVVLPGAIAEGRLVDFACADLAGSAQVVWMRREEASVRIGLRFISLAQAERDALATLLAGLRKERSASAVTRGA